MIEPEPEARLLGVIEAMAAARDQCPHGAVREHAARALELVRQRGAKALPEQAAGVLATLAGWRGSRADRVRRSLARYLEASASESSSPSGAPAGRPADRRSSRPW